MTDIKFPANPLFLREEDLRQGIELLFFESPTPSGAPSASRGRIGITHLSFYVDDVDTAAARLVECGGTVLEDTRSNPGVDLVFLTDPDGTRVELMKAGE